MTRINKDCHPSSKGQEIIIACLVTGLNEIFTFVMYFYILSHEPLYCTYIYIIWFPLFSLPFVHYLYKCLC